MTTPWPVPDRTDPPLEADERTMLEAWLDWHRDTLLLKCSGLTGEQLVTAACPPSSLTLLGLVRHLTDVERWWLRIRPGSDVRPLYWSDEHPDGDFDLVRAETADADRAAYLAEIETCRAEAARHTLDDTFPKPHRADPDHRVSLRWILVHLIEEYARHNGHADLLRERVDGTTGE